MKEPEEISLNFTDKNNKPQKFTARYFSDRQISTICDTVENPDTHKIDAETSKYGMTKEEILQFFSKNNGTCNVEKLIRSLMLEAYRKQGLPGKMDEGNVRRFWYTHIKAILVRIMGKAENNSIKSAINRSWGYAINSGAVTYEEMNIFSEKESGRLSRVKDSPFSNIIIGVEKLSFFNSFKWLPTLFFCTLITAGGQPSRAVARRFILELKNLHVDLNQVFHLCMASDLDPYGFSIQQAFKDQLDAAIKYYGGTGSVEIHRLFVRKDQVSPDLLEAQGMPWKPNSSKKARDTLWKHFCEKTDGGLYIPVPDGWTGDVFEIDGQQMVRALLEMDAFSTPVIEKAYVRELLKIIRETSDETKILIPETMRIFNELKGEISDELFDQCKKKLIDPLIEEFLKDTEKWKEFIDDKGDTDEEEINDRYDELDEEKEKEKYDRVPELFDKKDGFEKIISALKEERDEKISEIGEEYSGLLEEPQDDLETVEGEIAEKCEDIDDDIDMLQEKRDEELETSTEEYQFRLASYNMFKEEHVTVFNPLEQSLKADIDAELAGMDYSFCDLEARDETKKGIGGLCVNTKMLTEENISCFNHPVPTFKGDRFLEKAAGNKDLNIGRVRDSFTPTFMDAMRSIWRNDTIDIDFELSGTIEMPDLSQEIKDAIDETENELKNQRKSGDDGG